MYVGRFPLVNKAGYGVTREVGGAGREFGDTDVGPRGFGRHGARLDSGEEAACVGPVKCGLKGRSPRS